jgi:hypothetical protein
VQEENAIIDIHVRGADLEDAIQCIRARKTGPRPEQQGEELRDPDWSGS